MDPDCANYHRKNSAGMNQQLTIIIPVADDPALGDTIRSINATTPKGAPVRIIVVDDASKSAVCGGCLEKGSTVPIKVYRNTTRRGCAASRQFAAERAQTDWLMFTDAHMRFTKGWYEAFCQVIEAPANYKHSNCTLYCGTYISRQGADTYAPIGGSEFFFFREQFRTGNGVRMMEHDPLPEPNPAPATYEVPCAIGASYFIARDWFTELRGFEGLKGYGSDEPLLSIKTWLAGGSVRVMRDVRIEHVCQAGAASERDSKTLMLYNKLFILQTLFPQWMNDAIALMPPCEPDLLQDALFELHQSTALQIAHAEHFKSLFTRTPEDFCRHFSVEAPCATLAIGTP